VSTREKKRGEGIPDLLTLKEETTERRESGLERKKRAEFVKEPKKLAKTSD
jgi:hypothetical protein